MKNDLFGPMTNNCLYPPALLFSLRTTDSLSGMLKRRSCRLALPFRAEMECRILRKNLLHSSRFLDGRETVFPCTARLLMLAKIASSPRPPICIPPVRTPMRIPSPQTPICIPPVRTPMRVPSLRTPKG